MEEPPPIRSRDEAARRYWQGKIIYLALVLLVVIPLEEIVRRRPWEDPAPRPPAAEPQVLEAAAACDAGDAAACRKAARAYRYGAGAPLDEERAAVLLDRACALGDRGACVGWR